MEITASGNIEDPSVERFPCFRTPPPGHDLEGMVVLFFSESSGVVIKAPINNLGYTVGDYQTIWMNASNENAWYPWEGSVTFSNIGK